MSSKNVFLHEVRFQRKKCKKGIGYETLHMALKLEYLILCLRPTAYCGNLGKLFNLFSHRFYAQNLNTHNSHFTYITL